MNRELHHLLFSNPYSVLVFLTRLDEAAVAIQKEKNMYKEIENFPMCFKVGYLVVFTLLYSFKQSMNCYHRQLAYSGNSILCHGYGYGHGYGCVMAINQMTWVSPNSSVWTVIDLWSSVDRERTNNNKTYLLNLCQTHSLMRLFHSLENNCPSADSSSQRRLCSSW